MGLHLPLVMQKSSKHTPVAELSYADAMAELQQILADLQAEQVDIDQLATRIARANELIEICRARLRAAEQTIG
jgi:exodeoxyribonuclease VII small subunit